MVAQVNCPDGIPVPGQGGPVLDDQAELVNGDLTGRQGLAERGDDGNGGLLAGAVAQGHVGAARTGRGCW
jgi:hypothetical protein